jgi:hypothetical protein
MMTDEKIVGMENLPNVYIRSIQIGANDGTNVMDITLTCFDHKDNHSWFDRGFPLKIKVCLVTDLEKQISLVRGLDGIYNEENIEKIIYVDPPQTESLEQGNLIRFDFTRRIRNFNMSSNMFVFASFYYEPEEKIGIEALDRFYGPLTGEAIFMAGTRKESSGALYYSETNEIYYGPAHSKPNGVLMEGSFHSSEPHSEVVYVPFDNQKLVINGE